MTDEPDSGYYAAGISATRLLVDESQRIQFFAADAGNRTMYRLDNVELHIWYFSDEPDPDELEGLETGRSDFSQSPDIKLRVGSGEELTRTAFQKRFPSGFLIVKWFLLDGIKRLGGAPYGENRYNVRWQQYRITPDFPPQHWILITDTFRAGI
ncbi:hypothetical protein BLX24_03905 [Arsenicibacter rosenii]|uniref:Uncharacterized protein n=2 Tax=Arsenicibacter rosenii TaxID=1750698 RepID=A0A1S2VSA5_9BACT|nr:hypothetical protein BLX24_03905 [Arsenicibacter rosenii]